MTSDLDIGFGAGVTGVSRMCGLGLFAFEDSHKGLLAARRIADAAFGAGWNVLWGRSNDDDEVLFDAYWNWMRVGRYTFIVTGADCRPRWVVTANQASLSIGAVLDGYNKRVLSCIDVAAELTADDGKELERLGAHLGRSSEPPSGMEILCSEWLDEQCNLWLNRHVGDEDCDRRSSGLYDNETIGRYLTMAWSNDWQARLAVASSGIVDYVCFGEALQALAVDPCVQVRMAVARNTCLRDEGIIGRLAEDPDWRVRRAICQNGRMYADCRGIFIYRAFGNAGEIIRGLVSDPEYEVRLAAADVAVHAERDGGEYGRCVEAMLDSPYDDDFKAYAAAMAIEAG